MARKDKMNKKVGTLFPQTQDGCCALCKEEITDNRKKRYCSDRCKEIAYGVQKFYLWRKVREKVLENRENKCARCGYNPDERAKELEQKKKQLEEEYEDVRSVMMKGRRTLEVDHIKPVAKGGDVFDPDNLQILCDKCNRSKSDKWNGEKNLEDFVQAQSDSQ